MSAFSPHAPRGAAPPPARRTQGGGDVEQDPNIYRRLVRFTRPEGDCLVWVGHFAKQTKVPAWSVGGRAVNVRRTLWALAHEGPVPAGLQVGVACGTPNCVHPDCLIVRDKAAAQAHMRGRPISAAHRHRIAQGRRRTAKLDDAAVAVLRQPGTADDDRARAAQFGITPHYAGRIRRGEARVDLRNPFAQLMGLRR